MYLRFFKPLIDFVISLVMLVMLLPLLVLVALLLLIVNRGNVFFIQQRPGFRTRRFYLLKFKTMNNKADRHGNLLPDHQRITALGKFLRKTSIDELPQLINVLKGDLSLVGPRPLLMEYIPLYNAEQMKRHNVKPGITGWAQVKGRNAITWNERFKLDLYYVQNVSFWLDLKILLLTVQNVFLGKDVNMSDSVTMEKFKGTGKERS